MKDREEQSHSVVFIYEFNEESMQHNDRPDYVECSCGNRQWYHYDQYGEWSCAACDQRYNAAGQKLARSAWNAPDYGDYYDY